MFPGLKGMVISRLTFNSMFDPICERILSLKEQDFNTLFDKAESELNTRAQEIRIHGFSMGKRGCDTAMINQMKTHLIDVDREWCEKLIEENENHGPDSNVGTKGE